VTSPPAERHVAIIGGGITGLAAAHRLVELSREHDRSSRFTLFEASPRLGGVISTRERDGFLLEEGADSFITNKPGAKNLITRLGLADQLIGIEPKARQSFVVHGGRLVPTPQGFHLLAPSRMDSLFASPLFSFPGKLRIALERFLPPRRTGGDESVGEFVLRRFGREDLERMAKPMVAAIYGADPMRLSLRATFPRFLDLEREHGSVIRGLQVAAGEQSQSHESGQPASGPRYGLFATLPSGLGQMTEALIARLPETSLRRGAPVLSLEPASGGSWTVRTPDTAESFDAVVVATPAPVAGDLVESFDAEMARLLGGIPYHFSATVCVALRLGDVAHPMNGAGFVVSGDEGLTLLGCTFGHRKFAGRATEGCALLRAYFGNAGEGLGDDELAQRTLAELAPLLGIRGTPLFTHIARWPGGMPQYAVGHLDLVARIEELQKAHPGLALAGNAYRGVGIPDSIQSGERAAERLVENL
jgi:oxygen-dependent protoporphyrinogen oxidase